MSLTVEDINNEFTEAMLMDENPEPFICSVFGCGKELKLVERLAGEHCTAHMIRVYVDPTMVINY